MNGLIRDINNNNNNRIVSSARSSHKSHNDKQLNIKPNAIIPIPMKLNVRKVLLSPHKILPANQITQQNVLSLRSIEKKHKIKYSPLRTAINNTTTTSAFGNSGQKSFCTKTYLNINLSPSKNNKNSIKHTNNNITSSNTNNNSTNTSSTSLQDKIFSPGDFSKNQRLIMELTKQLLNNTSSSSSSSSSLSSTLQPSSIHKRQFLSPQSKPHYTQQPFPPYLPPKSFTSKHKKTLILDLDETLVHSALKPFINTNPNFILDIPFENQTQSIYVLIRPYVEEFLLRTSSLFELVVFTASIPEYANPLLNRLDPLRRISHRLFRQHCIYSNNFFIKDLSKINRPLNEMIIIDNNPISYVLNKDNGIPILSWYDDENDSELMKVLPFVEYLANVDDVRDAIRKSVDGGFVNYNVVNEMIKECSKGNGAVKTKLEKDMQICDSNNNNNNGVVNSSNNNNSHNNSFNVNRISYTDRNVSTVSSSKHKANYDDSNKLRDSIGITLNDMFGYSSNNNNNNNSNSSSNGIKTLKNSISSNTIGNGVNSVSSLSTYSILNRNKSNPFVLDMSPIMLNTSMYKDKNNNYNNEPTNGNETDENDFYSKAYESKRLTSSRTQNNIILPSNNYKPLQSNPNRKEIKKHFFSPKHTVMSLYTSNTNTNTVNPNTNTNNNTFGNLDDTLNQITTTSFNRHLSSSNYLRNSSNKFSLSRSSEKKCNVFSKENTTLNGSISSTDIKRISLHGSKQKEYLLQHLERKIHYIKTPTATISLHDDNKNSSKLKQIRIYTYGNTNTGKNEVNKSCSNIKKKHFITKIKQHDI